MKRCPQCAREYDVTMMFCLDDGAELLYGPAMSEPGAIATGFPPDEPQTAILSEPPASAGGQSNEAKTRAIIHTTAAETEPQNVPGTVWEKRSLSANRAAKPLIAAAIGIVVLVGGFFSYRFFNSTRSGAINSIAVLPFENRSGNPDTEYLSDGLSDSLIYRLSQLPNLKVSPTSSVIRYKGKLTDLAEIAKELDVDAAMSGKLAQRGDDLTISVELTDARTNKIIWAEQYDRKMADLLSTQREIANAITQKLQLKLAGDETGITKKYTNSNEAYQAYLKGRFNWNKRTEAGLKESIANYQDAIGRDPSFALAYSGLADTYVIIAAYGSVKPSDCMPKAKAAALRALEIDPSLAEPHAALSAYATGYAWDFERSEMELRKAIEINPRYATAWHWFGNFLPIVGKIDEAISAGKRAVELDPLSAIISGDLGFDMILVRRYDDAVAQGDHTLGIDPNFWYGHYIKAMAYELKGAPNDAIAPARKAVELFPNAITKGRLATILAKVGQREEAKRIVDELVLKMSQNYVQGYYLATAQLALGDKDAAFSSLERDFRERGIYMQWLRVNPEFDGIRTDPRYTDLIDRMTAAKID